MVIFHEKYQNNWLRLVLFEIWFLTSGGAFYVYFNFWASWALKKVPKLQLKNINQSYCFSSCHDKQPCQLSRSNSQKPWCKRDSNLTKMLRSVSEKENEQLWSKNGPKWPQNWSILSVWSNLVTDLRPLSPRICSSVLGSLVQGLCVKYRFVAMIRGEVRWCTYTMLFFF